MEDMGRPEGGRGGIIGSGLLGTERLGGGREGIGGVGGVALRMRTSRTRK